MKAYNETNTFLINDTSAPLLSFKSLAFSKLLFTRKSNIGIAYNQNGKHFTVENHSMLDEAKKAAIRKCIDNSTDKNSCNAVALKPKECFAIARREGAGKWSGLAYHGAKRNRKISAKKSAINLCRKRIVFENISQDCEIKFIKCNR